MRLSFLLLAFVASSAGCSGNESEDDLSISWRAPGRRALERGAQRPRVHLPARPETIVQRLSEMAGFQLGQSMADAAEHCDEDGGTLQFVERQIHRCSPPTRDGRLAHYIDVVGQPGTEEVGVVVVFYEVMEPERLVTPFIDTTRTLNERFGTPRSQSVAALCATAQPERLRRCFRRAPRPVVQTWTVSAARAGDPERLREAGLEAVRLTFEQPSGSPTWYVSAAYQREGYSAAYGEPDEE